MDKSYSPVILFSGERGMGKTSKALKITLTLRIKLWLVRKHILKIKYKPIKMRLDKKEMR